jgi:hypothetical protein
MVFGYLVLKPAEGLGQFIEKYAILRSFKIFVHLNN